MTERAATVTRSTRAPHRGTFARVPATLVVIAALGLGLVPPKAPPPGAPERAGRSSVSTADAVASTTNDARVPRPLAPTQRPHRPPPRFERTRAEQLADDERSASELGSVARSYVGTSTLRPVGLLSHFDELTLNRYRSRASRTRGQPLLG